jgi:hypothetical protein
MSKSYNDVKHALGRAIYTRDLSSTFLPGRYQKPLDAENLFRKILIEEDISQLKAIKLLTEIPKIYVQAIPAHPKYNPILVEEFEQILTHIKQFDSYDQYLSGQRLIYEVELDQKFLLDRGFAYNTRPEKLPSILSSILETSPGAINFVDSKGDNVLHVLFARQDLAMFGVDIVKLLVSANPSMLTTKNNSSFSPMEILEVTAERTGITAPKEIIDFCTKTIMETVHHQDEAADVAEAPGDAVVLDLDIGAAASAAVVSHRSLLHTLKPLATSAVAAFVSSEDAPDAAEAELGGNVEVFD